MNWLLLHPQVSSSGIISTVASVNAYGIAADPAGNLLVVSDTIHKVSTNGIITTVAGPGNPTLANFSGDGGLAASARLSGPESIAVDVAGNLFIADTANSRVRKVSPSGIITTVAGGAANGPGDGGPATSAQLFAPHGVAVDAAGNLFIADALGIHKVFASGVISTAVASVGQGAYGVAVDGAGNLFVAALTSVVKVSPDGMVTTVAGTGRSGFSGDGGPMLPARN